MTLNSPNRFYNLDENPLIKQLIISFFVLHPEQCLGECLEECLGRCLGGCLTTNTCATRAFISHSPIDKLIYQIYQLVGGFPAKMLSSCISQIIFFHMIGNKELPVIF